jgi:hypothetical protein
MSVEGEAPSGRIGDDLAADLDRPTPAEEISEWQETPKTNGYWIVWSIPVAVAGMFAYGALATGSPPTQSSFPLLPLVVAVAAVFGLHEAIHGIVIAAFGARPEFGVVRVGRSGVPMAVYTAARGHFFTRRQYLVVTAAPMVILSLAGIPACLSPLGGYLWLPFAWHLGGCIGDAIIVWRTLHQPADVLCQDLEDCTRFVLRASSNQTPA